MKLIVDFDDVLFKTSKLKEQFFAVLTSHGVKNAEEQYVFERKNSRPFSLWLFLRRVCVVEGIPDAGLLYEEVMSVCEDLINEELLSVLTEVGQEHCYIVTSGDDEFQKDKIVRSGIYKYVQEVIIVPGSKKEVIEALCKKFHDEEVVFVDDKEAFFSDIDRETHPNLRTVLYDERGLEVLKKAVAENKNRELSKLGPLSPAEEPQGGPKMR